ncbi:MAG: SipW-dependent-type signal peptide-containing protein [Clostridiaceae bacterium]|nr:SipW-dependent-type signal peptide-containing protein [Clostridiaceae bacterium]
MKKKSLLITLTAVMLSLALGIGGTIAYFTSITDNVRNVFTSGNVAITLDEAPVTYANDTWTADTEATRVQTNTYTNIYPGAFLPKDPTIHVAGTSQDAYVAMKVVVTEASAWNTIFTNHGLTNLDGIVAGYDEAKWDRLSKTVVGDTIVYVFAYNERVAADADLTLFTSLTIPTSLTNTELASVNEFTVTATGYAVQAQGLTYADAQTQLAALAATPAVV